MTEISRRQFAALAVVVVLVILLGGRALRADAGLAPPAGTFGVEVEAPAVPGGSGAPGRPGDGAGSGPDGGPAAAAGGGPTGPSADGGDDAALLVHVAGRVRRPGVYALAAGARVADALSRAGGAGSGADLDGLNLAAKVTDGQQVLVLKRGRRGPAAGVAASAGAGSSAAGGVGAPVPAPGASPAGGGPVEVNAADAVQLEGLNGVGPAIAAAIVRWRTENGPFKTVDDLALVPGIGPKKLEAMRAQVVV